MGIYENCPNIFAPHIIGLTGYDEKDVERECCEAGMTAVCKIDL